MASRRMGLWGRLVASTASVLTGHAMGPMEGSPRGSRRGRRSALFEQTRRHLNAEIAAAGAPLRGRVRFLCRENGMARSMKRLWVDYAVSTGWIPNVQHPTEAVPKALHEAFKSWTDSADFDGVQDFYGLQAMVAAEEFEAGEVFARLIPDPVVGLQIQLMQSEQLPYSNMAAAGYALPADNEVRLGVEFDGRGKRVAYHFYKRHPGDGTQTKVMAAELERIPAEELIHVFTPEYPGQIRGYSRLCSAVVPLFKQDEYEDALLERAAQSAKYIGTITRAGVSEDPKPEPGDRSADGARQYALETGILYELDDGEQINFTTPPDPGANFDDFERRIMARSTMAVGTPYSETTGDVKNANFVSARIGRQPFKRSIDRWGANVLVFQFCRRVWREWLRFGLLTQTIALPRGASRQVSAYQNVNWLPPGWEYVNPVDDAKADDLQMANKTKSRSQVVAEKGRNIEELDQEIARDQARAEGLGIVVIHQGVGTEDPPPAPPLGPESGHPNAQPAGGAS